MAILVQPQDQGLQRLYNQKHFGYSFSCWFLYQVHNLCFAWKHRSISDANPAVDRINKPVC